MKVQMQERKIYKTLRISFNDEIKLFPSWKIQGIDELKQKVISRFDMDWKKDDFQLYYPNDQTQAILILQNDKDSNKINSKLIQKLTNNKTELRVRKRQENLKLLLDELNKENHVQSIMQQLPLKLQKHYAQCDDCMQFPIIGVRYKCVICKNYDLCQVCYIKLQNLEQQKCHPFIKIRQPIQKIASIEVAYDDDEMIKMKVSCSGKKMEQEKVGSQNNFKKEIDQENLPQKYVTDKNFVQQLFNSSCQKRRNQNYNNFNRCEAFMLNSCS